MAARRWLCPTQGSSQFLDSRMKLVTSWHQKLMYLWIRHGEAAIMANMVPAVKTVCFTPLENRSLLNTSGDRHMPLDLHSLLTSTFNKHMWSNGNERKLNKNLVVHSLHLLSISRIQPRSPDRYLFWPRLTHTGPNMGKE